MQAGEPAPTPASINRIGSVPDTPDRGGRFSRNFYLQ